jgi:hypothetical protein
MQVCGVSSFVAEHIAAADGLDGFEFRAVGDPCEPDAFVVPDLS